MSRCMWFFYFCVIVNVMCFLNTDMIVHYSQSKNLTFGTIFGCSKKREKVSVLKDLSMSRLQFLFVDIRDVAENIHLVLHRYYHLAVVLDGDCENFTIVLNEHVDKKYFYETFHWLIASNAEEPVLDALSKVKLNINSDVHVAVPYENETVTIYDVYNPASEHGGKLVVKKLGYYKKNEGYKARAEENKYWIRKNMSGVMFRSAVVVKRIE